MTNSINIRTVRLTADEATLKYVRKKIGKLDKFFPRSFRDDVKIEVTLKEVNRGHGNKYEASIAIRGPHGKTFRASDSTLNILAAIDIVEAKLVSTLRSYKSENQTVKLHQKVFARVDLKNNKNPDL